MRVNKFILVILVVSTIVGMASYLGKQLSSETVVADKVPYLKDIITTYSGGKPIDVFEVYSDMGYRYIGGCVSVYDSPSQKKLLFYSTLDYTIERNENHE